MVWQNVTVCLQVSINELKNAEVKHTVEKRST